MFYFLYMLMFWQGVGKSNKLDIPMPNSKKAPIVGKMPWLKKDGRARNAIPKFQLILPSDLFL